MAFGDVNEEPIEGGASDEHTADHLVAADEADFDAFGDAADADAGGDDDAELAVAGAGADAGLSDDVGGDADVSFRIVSAGDDVEAGAAVTEDGNVLDVEGAGSRAGVDLCFDVADVPVGKGDLFAPADDGAIGVVVSVVGGSLRPEGARSVTTGTPVAALDPAHS